MTPIQITRKELFDLAWSIPMSRLAARFGISDVALAKTCRNHGIPTPGRGYWARIAAGAKPAKARLPKAEAGVDDTIVFNRSTTAHWAEQGAPPTAPDAPISERLVDPHPAVVWVEGALADAKPDAYGRLMVGPHWAVEVCVCKSSVARMLLLLDAACKALVARGHRVEARRRGEHSTVPEIAVSVGEQETAIKIEERLDRKPHVLTREEKAEIAKWAPWASRVPKYDYYAAGALSFKLAWSHYEYRGRKSWSDTPTRRLDDMLGQLVLAVEQAAEVSRVSAARQREWQEAYAAEERRALRAERLEWYRSWLMRDLEEMTSEWELAAVVNHLPFGNRGHRQV